MNKLKKIYSWMVRCSVVLGVILLINVWLLLSSHCLTFASTPKNDEMTVVNAENDKTENTPAFILTSDYDFEITSNLDFIAKYQAYFVNKKSVRVQWFSTK